MQERNTIHLHASQRQQPFKINSMDQNNGPENRIFIPVILPLGFGFNSVACLVNLENLCNLLTHLWFTMCKVFFHTDMSFFKTGSTFYTEVNWGNNLSQSIFFI
ncbi:hypothetical protein GDO86_011405 [Hymenochirus boettgeri]|uniref:Uncharacterized protein n=1 Tax=Hymenochirus boettgeri TaxID=247094 RepID=A0A8T2JGZ5_9PIPI|nr:hypothetical protein GDO86_011405 [Hymenochirus boettgeri]